MQFQQDCYVLVDDANNSTRIRPTYFQYMLYKYSAVAEMDDRFATIDVGQKLGAARCAPLADGEVVPHLTQCGQAEVYLSTKWHLDPSSRLATTDMSRKLEGCAPFGEGELGPHPTHCSQSRGVPPYQVAS